jgi:hypothetical protein
MRADRRRTLVITCGALASEVLDVVRLHEWANMEVTCLPAEWHMTPHRIPDGVRRKIRENRPLFDDIYCLFGDCGTGGALDAVLREEYVERIVGHHCYAFYAGTSDFSKLQEEEPATFYLTDFLVRNFERFTLRHMGLDKSPELMTDYFGNFRRVVYLAQAHDPDLAEQAQSAAARLGLPLETRFTGLENISDALALWRISR